MKKHWILYGILAGTFATSIGQTLAQGGGWTPPEWLKPTEYHDTVRKEFVTIWMDSGSPVVSVSRGQFEGGRVVMHSEDPDMQTGKLKKVRTTIGTTDDGKTVMTMFDVVPEGEDRMTMRLTYTKKE